jgi:hypothetical protein
MSLIRVQRTAAATLTRTFYLDETPTDCSGAVSVAVTRLDGSSVTSGAASHTGGTGSGQYTYTLPGGPTSPASATWQLDTLKVAWTGGIGGATVTLTDTVEVVGGFYFGLAEARDVEPTIADPIKYTTAALAAGRIQVEQECDRITGRAFVPRFNRYTSAGVPDWQITVPHLDIRTVRAASIGTTVLSGATLAAVRASSGGVLVRSDGSWWSVTGGGYEPGWTDWPWLVGAIDAEAIVIEYEYGFDMPPEELRRKAMKRLRTVLMEGSSGIPDRAASYTTQEGGTYRLTLPGRDSTGIPDVDAVYQRYAAPRVMFA